MKNTDILNAEFYGKLWEKGEMRRVYFTDGQFKLFVSDLLKEDLDFDNKDEKGKEYIEFTISNIVKRIDVKKKKTHFDLENKTIFTQMKFLTGILKDYNISIENI